jgi:HTH-type transcriptional repressor of NAD biosynthesis genes
MTTGLVLGKFYPPTKGHQYLIEYAQDRVDKLIVVVGSLPTEKIPAEQRVLWLQQMVKRTTQVISIPDDNPPNLHQTDNDYWLIWIANLKENLPYIPDMIFGSEDYIKELADRLGIGYKMVDQKRIEVPISATMVRSDPKKYWDYIPDVVKPYYEGSKND